MIKEIEVSGRKIVYHLNYKNVKNINLRIKYDGSISVSANRMISQKRIDEFIISKADFILTALEKFSEKEIEPLTEYFSEQGIKDEIEKLCKKVYPYFRDRGVDFPVIKFRKMVSQWGNCRGKEKILTFNINLRFAPPECVEYVVLHEFTHFLHMNHSADFYNELSGVCPEWRKYKKILSSINIRQK